MREGVIENVSDTAFWVATYRARESERRDALFQDPYARRLIGDHGERITRSMPPGAGWALVVRTQVLDEIILRLVREGRVDTVINLAAGLDARPYRLPLPASLRWVEVDLPPMVAYKAERLAGETPSCRLERIPQDLADAAGRRAVFERLDSESSKVLVITEGLLPYLSEAQQAALVEDLHAQKRFRYWLFDLMSPMTLESGRKHYGKRLEHAPFRFTPADVTFYTAFGYEVVEQRDLMEEAQRLHREMPFAWLLRWLTRTNRTARQRLRRLTEFVLLERVGADG